MIEKFIFSTRNFVRVWLVVQYKYCIKISLRVRTKFVLRFLKSTAKLCLFRREKNNVENSRKNSMFFIGICWNLTVVRKFVNLYILQNQFSFIRKFLMFVRGNNLVPMAPLLQLIDLSQIFIYPRPDPYRPHPAARHSSKPDLPRSPKKTIG